MGHSGEYLIRRMLLRSKHYKRVDQTLPTAERVRAGSFVSKFMWSQSGITAFDQIMEALKEEATNKIGLYGTGGCGKTALVKQLGREVMERKLFDEVVFVTVSSSPSITRMQRQVADMLGLRFEEASEAGRARRLWLRLQSKERTLIILDDIWAMLDLDDLGIPCDAKLIFTTRNKNLCVSMDCQRCIPLNLLSEDEAWTLFQNRAGLHDGSTNLDVAREIVRECMGLPIAIEVVGDALRGTAVEEWRQLLKSLRSSETIPEEENLKDNVYKVLKLSYSQLGNELSKLMFLVCCMFPEDHQILIEDLIKLAIRLDLCHELDLEAAGMHVKVAIGELIDSCLLMQSDTQDYVKVHDLVHEIGLLIMSEEDSATMANLEKGVKELTKNKTDRLDLENGGEATQLSSTQDTTPFSVAESCTMLIEDPLPVVGEAVTIPKPSGNMVDFDGLCLVDESFLPLLKDACVRTPHLMERHRGNSMIFRQCAFNCLGQVLFLLKNVRIKDMVHYKDELQMFWEDVKVMKLDLEWLSPVVETALSSTVLLQEADRIGELQENVKNWSTKAAKLREDLRVLEDKVADAQREIELIQPKLDSLGITDVYNYFSLRYGLP